jgi:hypothetical protein
VDVKGQQLGTPRFGHVFRKVKKLEITFTKRPLWDVRTKVWEDWSLAFTPRDPGPVESPAQIWMIPSKERAEITTDEWAVANSSPSEKAQKESAALGRVLYCQLLLRTRVLKTMLAAGVVPFNKRCEEDAELFDRMRVFAWSKRGVLYHVSERVTNGRVDKNDPGRLANRLLLVASGTPLYPLPRKETPQIIEHKGHPEAVRIAIGIATTEVMMSNMEDEGDSE